VKAEDLEFMALAKSGEPFRAAAPKSRTPSAAVQSRPRVVVTFDEGNADDPLGRGTDRRGQGIPITVFVTSGAFDSEQGF
jgi:hypothetical protein